MRIFLLFIMLICSIEAKSLFTNHKQKDNSIYIGALKDLMIATQKTRGLTNSFLNGNASAIILVYNNRDDMKKAIGEMEALSVAEDVVVNNRATAISQALIRLNTKAFDMEPTKAFSDYTEQIGQILMLAQTVNRRFEKDLNPFGKDVSGIMMEIMLPLTEYVGQMRGFGAGLAAKGSVSEKELNKINILSNQIKKLNEKLQQKMIQLISEYSSKLPQGIENEILEIHNAVEDYTSFAENKFKNDIESVEPNNYFDDGTKLISLIIKAYNSNNKALLKDSEGWI